MNGHRASRIGMLSCLMLLGGPCLCMDQALASLKMGIECRCHFVSVQRPSALFCNVSKKSSMRIWEQFCTFLQLFDRPSTPDIGTFSSSLIHFSLMTFLSWNDDALDNWLSFSNFYTCQLPTCFVDWEATKEFSLAIRRAKLKFLVSSIFITHLSSLSRLLHLAQLSIPLSQIFSTFSSHVMSGAICCNLLCYWKVRSVEVWPETTITWRILATILRGHIDVSTQWL